MKIKLYSLLGEKKALKNQNGNIKNYQLYRQYKEMNSIKHYLENKMAVIDIHEQRVAGF